MRTRKKIGLFESWRTIRQLEKLKDLIRHDQRWAHQVQLARPLKKLGIKEKDIHRNQKIREMINRFLPLAHWGAELAGVSTIVIAKEEDVFDPDQRGNPKWKERSYDLFDNYDHLQSKDRSGAYNFGMTIDVLDQIIGFFCEIRTRKLVALANPLKWMAFILGLPIYVLEYMGFDKESAPANRIMSIIIQIAMALFLAVLAVRYGEESAIIKQFLKFLNPAQR